MREISIKLKNCYGIRELSADFDFKNRSAIAIYAPNGVMKSSLASTFSDIELGRDSEDRIFPQRETERSVVSEDGIELGSENVLVVHPYDEDLSVNEHTSTLLIDPKLKSEYDTLIRSAMEL